MTDWAARRQRTLRRRAAVLRIVSALGWAALSLGVLLVITAITGNVTSASALIGIKDVVEIAQLALTRRGIAYRIGDADVFIIAAIVTFALAWLRGGERATTLADRLFPSYWPVDFRPIRAPRSEIGADAILPWASQSHMGDAARAIVQRLTDQQHTGDDKRPFWRPRQAAAVAKPFDHILILGRPGAGKSRLAEHVARTLGRRKELGDSADRTDAARKFAQAIAREERWRRWLWFRARRRDDPWDSGELPKDKGPTPLFDAWRPARPTIFWLDDPTAEVARLWFAKLQGLAPTYRFPVRLIISNQAELAGIPNPGPDNVVTLRQDTYFTEPQIRALAIEAKIPRFDRERDPEAIRALTDGNPLLVELAFEAIRAGRVLADLDRDDLIAERVARVRKALVNVSPVFEGASALAALALGTLAGPDCPLEQAQHFPGHNLGATLLRSAFPAEVARGVDLSAYLPMIKPTMIGDAFVRSLADDDAALAPKLSDVLFSVSTDRWALAAWRLGQTDKNDRTANAFSNAPSGFATARVEAQESACKAWLKLAYYGWREPILMAERIDKALSSIDPTPPRQALAQRLFDWHCDCVEQDWADRELANDRWWGWLDNGKAIADAVVEQERAAQQPIGHRYFSSEAVAACGLMLVAQMHDRCDGKPPAIDDYQPRMDAVTVVVGQTCRLSSTPIKRDAFYRWARRLFPSTPLDNSQASTLRLSILSQDIRWPLKPAVGLIGALRDCFAESVRWGEHATLARSYRPCWLSYGEAGGINIVQDYCAVMENVAQTGNYDNDQCFQLRRLVTWMNFHAICSGNSASIRCFDNATMIERLATHPLLKHDEQAKIITARAWALTCESYAVYPPSPTDSAAERCALGLAKVETIAKDAPLRCGGLVARAQLADMFVKIARGELPEQQKLSLIDIKQIRQIYFQNTEKNEAQIAYTNSILVIVEQMRINERLSDFFKFIDIFRMIFYSDVYFNEKREQVQLIRALAQEFLAKIFSGSVTEANMVAATVQSIAHRCTDFAAHEAIQQPYATVLRYLSGIARADSIEDYYALIGRLERLAMAFPASHLIAKDLAAARSYLQTPPYG